MSTEAVLIAVAPEVIEHLFTRDHLGNRLSVDWGERGADGFHVPTISVDYTDNLVTAALTELRAEFLRLLTQNSETKDGRRRGFNQAIFDADEGWAIWNSTDLGMVMEKLDKAIKAIPK